MLSMHVPKDGMAKTKVPGTVDGGEFSLSVACQFASLAAVRREHAVTAIDAHGSAVERGEGGSFGRHRHGSRPATA